ncbi:HET-domain-containing protein, partial [Bimuria novae-zelandiae CBS 107.79]
MRRWTQECNENHPNCQERADKGFLPTRLLDVTRNEDRVYLVQSNTHDIRKPYATLSYSWGRVEFTRLQVDVLRSFVQEGIPVSDVPKSIQEAIAATRMIGLQYIWIDSLCIIQDSPEDWSIEASLMLQVYRNSFVNFAATDTAGADGGMFRKRNPRALFDAECQGQPNSRIFGNAIWRIVPKALWGEHVLSASLNTRGWVFQERLLSPRLLHFTKDQVFWDCATMSACETFPGGLPQPLDTGSNDRYWRWKLQDSSNLNFFLPTVVDQSLEQFWRNAIRTYSVCRLTVRQDKLIAIWGIVRFLIGALRERYADGMWERNLEEQLAWYVVGTQQGDGRASERPSGVDIPTWSWASVDGEIVLPDRFAAVRDYQVVSHDGTQIIFNL